MSCLHAQEPVTNPVPVQEFDPTAVAVEMDSSETAELELDTNKIAVQYADTVGIDTSAIAVDLDSIDEAQLLFRILDPILPDVVLEQLSDSVFQMVRVNDDIYGKIMEISGEKRKVFFKLYDNYRWNETHPYIFEKVYEYILTEDIDIIAMIAKDKPAVYVTFCSRKPLCNHLAYLIEFSSEARGYTIFEMESRNGADVAMFNYTLDNVNEAANTYIYPVNDLKKAPKKSFWNEFGKVATSVAGGALVALLLTLLLLL